MSQSQPKRLKVSEPSLEDLSSQLEFEGYKLDTEDELTSLGTNLHTISQQDTVKDTVKTYQYRYDSSGKLCQKKRAQSSSKHKKQKPSLDYRQPTDDLVFFEGEWGGGLAR